MIPPFARRFVAGESAAAALDHARRRNAEGIGVLLNRLGEHYTTRGPADADRDAYLQVLDDLVGTALRARLTVKPTQLGLDVDESVFRENLDRIVTHAATSDAFVWVDMENHDTIDATLDAVETLATEHGDVGVAIQANMRRTGDDLERLADCPAAVRLVKGAYDPPAAVAYRDSRRVDRAYRRHLRYLFEQFDEGIAVGSHDPAMIDLAADLHDEFGTPYEIQMLMGVREDAQRALAADRDVWQYAPYGERWLAYFYRRVAERRANLWFAVRAVYRSLAP